MNIENKLDIIIKKLENIEKKLDIVETSCVDMDNHINFVNGVYSIVRTPLNFIVNKISSIQGKTTQQALPEK